LIDHLIGSLVDILRLGEDVALLLAVAGLLASPGTTGRNGHKGIYPGRMPPVGLIVDNVEVKIIKWKY
jgi:hypothetical protein